MESTQDNLEKQDLQVIERVSESNNGEKTSPTDPDAALRNRLRVNVDGREDTEESFRVRLFSPFSQCHC